MNMGWFIRKSVRMGPMRLNFSRRGVGVSTGVKGFRVGTGPRGPYVAGGRGGLYFRQSLRARKPRAARSRGVSVARPPVMMAAMVPPPPPPSSSPFAPAPPPYAAPPAPYGAPPQYAPTSPFAPPQYGPPLMTPPPPRTFHQYSVAVLAGVTSAHALSWLLIGVDSNSQSAAQTASGTSSFGVAGNLGMLLFLASLVAVAVLDWHGFISLRGRIPWWRLSAGQKFWIVCAYVFAFEIMVPIYLVGAWIDLRRERISQAQQRPFKIAQMEANMGLVPPTEGVCRACGKPLQAGAQFCAYCRAPVVAHAKVCPACAATALPGAQWCPACGAALPV
ncbi:MAG: DUF4236 domain-containing protein [Ktedonobacterales bacterium]